MFNKSAKYYDELYHFKDYKLASLRLREWIKKYSPGAKTLLDVACGTAKHIEHLQEDYHVEGLDVSQDLLDQAKKRCPEVTFHQADMIDFQLKQKFDVITCLFSSIGYVKSLDNLNRAVSCMGHHVKPGQLLIIEPFFGPDEFWTDYVTANFVDQPELKICWMYTAEARDRIAYLEINYMVGTPSGIEHFVEPHEIGLFTAQEYKDAFVKAGFKVDFDDEGLFGRGMYIGIKEN